MRYLHARILIAIVAGVCVVGVSGAAAAQSAPRCEVEQLDAPANTTIVSVQTLSSPVPYCRADGYVTTTNPGRTG